MRSPVAKEPMLILELAGVEIDYCPATGGIWLDAGELEELLDDKEAAETLMSSFTEDSNNKEKKIRCPICRKKMEKVLVAEKVLIDRCQNGHGLWFDEGELMEVLELNQRGDAAKVTTLLKDMFNHHINKENH